MSRDTQGNKESWSQRAKGNQRKQRNEGGPSWYDKAVDTNYQEEVMKIPTDKVGLVIGRKGRTIKDVKERSGVKELFITDDLVHLRGTEEQRANAKRIIEMILRVRVKCSQLFTLNSLKFFFFCDLTIHLFNLWVRGEG